MTQAVAIFLFSDPHLEFPSQYPVGCLLGCVDVVDCMAQDPYREKVKFSH